MGFQIASTAQEVSAWAMIGSGLLSFLSPCILPMLPVYATYLLGSGSREESVKAVILRALGLMTGFLIFFTLIGAGAGAVGGALGNVDKYTLQIISGALMIVLALMLLELIPGLPAPGVGGTKARMEGFFGSLGFGVVLALSWTPCLTPLLANALLLVTLSDQATVLTGMGYLALYALGLCLPMMLFLFLYRWLGGALRWLRKAQPVIRRIAGDALFALGLWYIVSATVLR